LEEVKTIENDNDNGDSLIIEEDKTVESPEIKTEKTSTEEVVSKDESVILEETSEKTTEEVSENEE
jgi:hypothetical protein